MLKDQTKRKLTKPQLNHALNRLQVIYQGVTAGLNKSYKHCVDWNDEKEVEAFAKEYKLEAPTWKEFGHYYINGSMPNTFYSKIDAAVNKKAKTATESVGDKLMKATSFFVTSQDRLIFDVPPSGDQMTKFLSDFETDLKKLVK